MKTETVTKLAEKACRDYWRLPYVRGCEAFDKARARVNRAIKSGKISLEDAQAAWMAGYEASES